MIYGAYIWRTCQWKVIARGTLPEVVASAQALGMNEKTSRWVKGAQHDGHANELEGPWYGNAWRMSGVKRWRNRDREVPAEYLVREETNRQILSAYRVKTKNKSLTQRA